MRLWDIDLNRRRAGRRCQIERRVRSIDDVSSPSGMKLKARLRRPSGDGVLVTDSEGSLDNFRCWEVKEINVQIIIVSRIDLLIHGKCER